MERMEITEKCIIRCLSEYEALLKDIRERMGSLQTSMDTTWEMIETLQTARKNRKGSRAEVQDIEVLLERYADGEKEYCRFLEENICQLMLEEEVWKRVWICFHALPYYERRVLDDLYVKKKAWKEVQYNLKLPRSSLSSYRSTGLENIRQLYDSDFSNSQIMLQGVRVLKAPEQKAEQEDGQVSIWNFLNMEAENKDEKEKV